jgi:hypothetical protein
MSDFSIPYPCLLKNRVVEENRRRVKKKYRGNHIYSSIMISSKIYWIINIISSSNTDASRDTRLDLARS